MSPPPATPCVPRYLRSVGICSSQLKFNSGFVQYTRRWGASSLHEGIIPHCIVYLIIIYHDFLLTPRRGRQVKSDYSHTIIKHTSLSSYIMHMCHNFQQLRQCSLVAPLMQYAPTASCNGIPTPLQGRSQNFVEGGGQKNQNFVF